MRQPCPNTVALIHATVYLLALFFLCLQSFFFPSSLPSARVAAFAARESLVGLWRGHSLPFGAMLHTPEPLGMGLGNRLHWYVRQLQQPWKALLAVGVCLALVAASIGIGGLGFAAQLSISFLPSPALTDVYAAYENFLENNPVFVNGDIEAILMSRTDGLAVFDDSLLVSGEALGNAVISAVNASVHDLPGGELPPAFRIRWFYTYNGTDLTGLAFQYVYRDFSAMMIAIEFDNAADVSDSFLNAMEDAVSQVQSNYTEAATGWSITATGRFNVDAENHEQICCWDDCSLHF